MDDFDDRTLSLIDDSTPMLDITRNYHRGDARSTEAHDSIVPTKLKQRGDVLREIVRAGDAGLTSDEAEQILGLWHQACSARFTELKALGMIECAGQRPTRSGRNADAWRVITQEGNDDDCR